MFGPHPQVFRQQVLNSMREVERQQEEQADLLRGIQSQLSHIRELIVVGNDVRAAAAELDALMAQMRQMESQIGWN